MPCPIPTWMVLEGEGASSLAPERKQRADATEDAPESRARRLIEDDMPLPAEAGA
jgi:hypothetical protein